MSRSFESVQLGSIELFCKAAEQGSFTGAAEVLGITPASVSRSISRLESRLGVRLFNRTTRNVRLTSDGQLYYLQCQQALEQIAEAERIISGQHSQPKGLLRVSVGTVYGHHRLAPLLPAFMSKYPEVELELNISNRNIDFVEDGYDLAIRLGEPQDSRVVARKLEDASVGVFCSPAYLAKRGRPQSLEALHKHDLIQFILPSTGRPMPWVFKNEQSGNIDFNFSSRQRVHEDVLASVGWSIAGGGLFQIYHFVAKEAVAQGQLVEVLQDIGGCSRPFYVLYPQNWHLSARVRAFVDYLASAVRESTC
ncbi:MAG: LysR substrate-binding domain-containing protein [Morganella sp. (in: enterobacteria)]|uniref:LysR family transcriptional regulator n=1 Tax=Citrobacter tructae TaxID=2562449 RepID=A0ABX5T7P5_9ENTR|nr:LysR family transcriptional regulator [Citrobacter tructae]QBX81587.1 LysR family transcriptional regulator [Citrobacter tructae]